MSVVTLALQWGWIKDPTDKSLKSGCRGDRGWGVKINGLRPNERDYFRAAYKSQPMVESDQGHIINLQIAPRQQPLFDSSYGADKNNFPVELITEYLNTLAAVGYRIVGTTSVATADGNTTTIWTLQQGKKL